MGDPTIEPTPVTAYESRADITDPQIEPPGNLSIDCPEDRLANLRERFAAWITDHLIVGALVAAVLIGYFYFTGQPASWFEKWARQNLFLLLSGAGLGYFLYFFCCEGVLMATPGKLLAGIQLRKKSGGSPSIFAILVRNLFRLVDYPLFFLTGAGMAEGTEHHQRLGDFLAGTILVKKKRPVLVKLPMIYAGTLRRGIAFGFDLLLILAFSYGLLFSLPTMPQTTSFILLSLTPLFIILYPVLSERLFHSTFGKALLGLKVLTEEGTSPSFSTLLLRNLLSPVDLNPLSYLLVFLGRQKQRIGDLFAGTVVIAHRKGWRSWLAIPFMLVLASAAVAGGALNHNNFFVQGLEIRVGQKTVPVIPPVVERYLLRSLRLESLQFAFDETTVNQRALFKPGDLIYLKIQLAGFKRHGDQAWIQGDLQVSDAQGNPVLQSPNIINHGYPVDWKRLLTLSTRFALHPRALPGNYHVLLTLRDRFGGDQIRQESSFIVP